MIAVVETIPKNILLINSLQILFLIKVYRLTTILIRR